VVLDNLSSTGTGQSDQGVLDNLSRGTGQQGVQTKEHLLELSEREGESGSAEFEQVLQGLRTGYPEHRRVIDRLIEPLLRRRVLAKAPDPVFALAAVAKKGARLSDEILDAAVELVADERGCTFKPADVEKALKEAAAAMPSAAASSKPTSPETSKLRAALREHFGEAVFSAWFAGIAFVERTDDGAAVVSVPDGFLRKYIEQHYAGDLLICAIGALGVQRVQLTVEARP